MWGNKENKSVELTQSILLAFESLRQALQLWFGREILVQDTTFSPNKIDKQPRGREERRVIVEFTFCFMNMATLEHVMNVRAEVDLMRRPWISERWCLSRILFECNGSTYTVHTNDLWPLSSATMEVRCAEGPGHGDRWIGRTIADRKFSNISNRAIITEAFERG